MSVRIEPWTSQDVAEKAQIELEAFRSHPRMPMMWPKGYTTEYFAYKQQSDIEDLDDPNHKAFKAVDASDGSVLGSSEWTFALDSVANANKKPSQPDAPPPDGWPEGGNWQMRLWYKINSEKLLKLYLSGKPYISLDILAILPSAQGRGIGTKLLAWGIEEAERRQVAIVLESTPIGLGLYKKFGFEEIEIINADMRQFGWKEPYDEAAAVRIFMIRHPRRS